MIDLRMGDCLEIMATMGKDSVDLIMADIPYGEVSQKSSGLRTLDRGTADACDIDIDKMVDECVRLTKGSFYIFCGTEQISKIVSRFKANKLTTRVGVWEKSNPSPMNGTKLWLSGLEFCVFARKPNSIFNEHCQKALWKAPSGQGKIHPTQKPIKLIERLILASSAVGDTVLDYTMGSGTTGVACKNTGRSFIGIERDPEYFRIASDRISGILV